MQLRLDFFILEKLLNLEDTAFFLDFDHGGGHFIASGKQKSSIADNGYRWNGYDIIKSFIIPEYLSGGCINSVYTATFKSRTFILFFVFFFIFFVFVCLQHFFRNIRRHLHNLIHTADCSQGRRGIARIMA